MPSPIEPGVARIVEQSMCPSSTWRSESVRGMTCVYMRRISWYTLRSRSYPVVPSFLKFCTGCSTGPKRVFVHVSPAASMTVTVYPMPCLHTCQQRLAESEVAAQLP